MNLESRSDNLSYRATVANVHVDQITSGLRGIGKSTSRAADLRVKPLGHLLGRHLRKFMSVPNITKRHCSIRFESPITGKDGNPVVGLGIVLLCLGTNYCQTPINALTATPAMPTDS